MTKIIFDSTIENSDKVTKIDVIDDDYNILESAVIYAEESFDSYLPGIYNADKNLYSIMRHLYNSAKCQEDVKFERKVNGELDEEEL